MKKILLSIALLISATASWALEVECTPGNLANLIDDTSITSLTVTGQMDARDFMFIYNDLDALTIVDLSGATIVGYSNHTQPLFNNEVDYPENCIPPMSFFGKRITEITLPAGTRAIGMAAFAGCNQLTNFTFPEGIDSIAAYAFSGAKISRLYLPASVKFMGKGAFSNITTLSLATITPDSPMEIPSCAFEGCTSLNNVTIGPNVTAIGDRAFKGTSRIYNFVFSNGNNITHIGKEAFLGSRISNFNFEATNITDIGDWAFAQSKQVSATIPANNSHVGKGAFYYATELTSYVPNAACDTIAEFLLAGTAVSNNVTENTQVQHIGKYALYNTPITTLTLPSTTAYIGDQAMAGMIDLQELTSKAIEVPELGEEVWLGVKQATIPLKVPQDSYEAYSTADQWSRFLVWSEEEPHGIFGDVNQDGYVSASDVTCVYDILLGNSTDFMDTADVNGDGVVTAADITCIYNILLGNENVPGRNKKTFDSNDIIFADGFVIEAGKTHTMDIEMRNSAQFAALQLDITMPQGLTINNVTATSRTSNMAMGFNEIEPGKWRILVHSATTINGNKGTLFNITVKADDYFTGNETISIDNIIAVEPTELVHEIGDVDVEVGTTTGVKDINIDTADNGPVDVYNVNGQLLRQNIERSEATTGLPSGIYIVGGKKVIVK
ncbi:MAG: leucine-rich repeat protein [Muribaculaceae bacterium]|nr:leucine-rich repeat protein [Muribaculaceae bacterium]